MSLDDYFEMVKKALALPAELRLVVKPGHPTLNGEVINDTIFVYTDDPEEAKYVIIHECLDLLITRLIQYARSTNDPDKIYEVKEAIVEILARLISPDRLRQYATTNYIISILSKLCRSDLIE
mgnify:CR=1 FL=1